MVIDHLNTYLEGGAATAAIRIHESLTAAGFAWVVAGGLLYTGGVVFYALDHRHRYAHGVWHLFVLAGSASHFIAVIGFV